MTNQNDEHRKRGDHEIKQSAQYLGQRPDSTSVDRAPGVLAEKARERMGDASRADTEAQERELLTDPPPGGDLKLNRPGTMDDVETDVESELHQERLDLARRAAGAESGGAGNALDARHLEEDDLDSAVQAKHREDKDDG